MDSVQTQTLSINGDGGGEAYIKSKRYKNE